MSSSADLTGKLQQLVDNTTFLVPGAGLDERNLLRQSLVKLTLCIKGLSTSHMCRTDWGGHVRLEVDAQIRWINIYRLCREQRPFHNPVLPGYLVPHSKDPEPLFVAFAREVLEGAFCLATILQAPEQQAWVRVDRAKRRSALSDRDACTEESEYSADDSEDSEDSENSEDSQDSQDSEDDCLDEPFQYNDAYF